MSQPARASHILPTAANLLGFTFLVLTSMRGLGLSQNSTIADLTGVCVVLFALSTLLSFLSLHTQSHATQNYEHWAARIFLVAVITCFVLSVLLVFDLI